MARTRSGVLTEFIVKQASKPAVLLTSYNINTTPILTLPRGLSFTFLKTQSDPRQQSSPTEKVSRTSGRSDGGLSRLFNELYEMRVKLSGKT